MNYPALPIYYHSKATFPHNGENLGRVGKSPVRFGYLAFRLNATDF